ncbi:MAG: metallophosphoesterase [Lentimicrobiaceae bacterium]
MTKFPNATTRAITRMLIKDYPVDFTESNTRSLVREHRGELLNQCIKNTTSVRTEEEKKFAMRKFKTDYKPVKDYILPKSFNRGVIINDLHIPYHDQKALATMVEFAIDYKPNFLYINGDFIDMYQLSRFTKDRRLRDFAGELEMARNILANFKEILDVPIIFKIGNHEDRLESYLRINAPELLGIEDFEIGNLLRFGEMGIIEVKSRQKCMMGKLAVFHGHEFGHQIFSPVNPARGLYMKAKHSSAAGHHHRTSEHTEKDIADELTATWSIGALCGMHPEYLPFNNWNHGFATIEIKPSGNYMFGNRKIIEGKIY